MAKAVKTASGSATDCPAYIIYPSKEVQKNFCTSFLFLSYASAISPWFFERA